MNTLATINGIDLLEMIIAFIIGRGFQKMLEQSKDNKK